ncbi:MAG: hypothetical protein ACPG7F_04890 [Aggregatilineales bacterium]
MQSKTYRQFAKAWHQAMTDQTHDISTLWEDFDSSMSETLEQPTTDRPCPICGETLIFDCYVWNPAYREPRFKCDVCGEGISASELYYGEGR